jgi:geranylgeranyl reductase family protein
VRYDVAVVGAGPGGSWTATLLARRGARVLLVDPSHPREKPCGGGITGRALAIVGDGVAPTHLPSVRVRTARFVDSQAHQEATVPLSNSTVALVVASRAAFDNALYDAAREAGAETRTARVTGLHADGAGFRLATSDHRHVDASFIVGADGANSLVRRRLSTPFRRDQLSIATGFFAHGVTSEEIVIELFTEPPGYIWSFPRPDHLAIGICVQADTGVSVSALRARVQSWITTTGIANGGDLQPYSWPIPSLSALDFGSIDLAGPGWLTVGDAAGLVDPITREGIFFALQSAAAAADALTSMSPNPSRAFTENIRRGIGAELARAARYKAGFFRPRFTRMMIDALQSSGRVRAVMADLVAGTQDYRSLKWRLARTMEIGFAWRLIRNS